MTIPPREDAIYGDDEYIIDEMKRVENELNDRIAQVQNTANTTGLDTVLAETLHKRLADATTHLTSGANTALVNIDAARDRMAISENSAGRTSSINTGIGAAASSPAAQLGRTMATSGRISPHMAAGPLTAGPVQSGGAQPGSMQSGAAQPGSMQSGAAQPGSMHTSAGGTSPAPATAAVGHSVPATPMRNGAYVPPQARPMPDDYAQRLGGRTPDMADPRMQQARQAQLAQVQAQREQQDRLAESQRAQREALLSQESRERAAERESKVDSAKDDDKLQEVLKEWRNEVSQMDAEHQEEVLDHAGDTVSREEAVEIIEEALADYYDDEGSSGGDGGVDAVEADGGAYSGGGGLEAAGSVGMDESEVSFDQVNMGTMDDETIHAYIEDALDLNGWTTDPAVREQVHNLMYNMAMHESGGNPNAANGWDSNAVGETQADGFPYQSSRGTWQTIPQTFATYHVEGTSNSIYDPQASAASSLAYMMDRYGFDPQTGAGVAEFGSNRGIDVNSGQSSGAYLGY